MIPWLRLGIAAAIVLAAFGAGWGVRDAFCDAAYWKDQVAQKDMAIARLKLTIASAAAAAKADAEALKAAKEETDRLEEASRELENHISVGVCFPESDADRLRQLWRGGVTVRPAR